MPDTEDELEEETDVFDYFWRAYDVYAKRLQKFIDT